jgi:membrane protease YdiL (CAAX protease family)
MTIGAYLGPITAAFLVTAIADGKAGLRLWVGRMLKWRVSRRWYLSIVIGVPAALTATSIAVSDGAIQMAPTAVLLAYAPVLLFQMITTGIAEEPGWRDFAQPRLQRRYGPLSSPPSSSDPCGAPGTFRCSSASGADGRT